MDLRALVVCSDQDSASLLALILSEMGMAVEHTPSIARGLELLETQRYDGIILDYRADQSSEEFLARLRQSTRNHASTLIAIVDSDFNARPVFGLGASFVLYRPLSSERTRISLRAARSLMRRERRRTPRASVNSNARIAYPGAPEGSVVLSDLSDGGTQLQTATRLPSPGKVYFEFALPGQKEVVRLSGEVAWQDASGRTGIRFLDVPQASRRLIQTWLRQRSAQPSSLAPATPGPAGAHWNAAESGLESKSHPSARDRESKDSTSVAGAGNRRRERRFPCKLGAEVYRVGTGVPNFCTLADISEGGCYVEMPSPLAGQSSVEIRVRTAHAKLRIRGQVITTHPGFGMGVRFEFRDSMEREELLRVLAVLSAGPTLDSQLR
ncbi:MAG: PilZ domain-containing protein [Terriglobales bacterium]